MDRFTPRDVLRQPRDEPKLMIQRMEDPIMPQAAIPPIGDEPGSGRLAVVYFDQLTPIVEFGLAELRAALEEEGRRVVNRPLPSRLASDPEAPLRVVVTSVPESIQMLCSAQGLALPSHTTEQSYAVRTALGRAGLTCFLLAADPAGAMYAAMHLAERIRLGQRAELPDGDYQPHIAKRGIKFNIPLDLRTPSYSDAGDAAQHNIAEMWSMDFWRIMLDEMARHRFNVLTLWNLHPFPSIVRVPEYPQVALDDVWRTTAALDDTFNWFGIDMVRPEMLERHQVVRRLSMDQKIDFWRQVMRHAHDRAIEVYWFTWNMFTFGAQGKHGITCDQANPVTLDYFRRSVRETILTYPLLAGIGVTAGENLAARRDEYDKEKWLYKAYGLGIADALSQEPGRPFRLIHRYHMAQQDQILREWKDLPCPMDLSFKYAIAHMYSSAQPPFARKALEELPPDRRMWMTIRNDDIYSFRWGDPDYARSFIKALPASDKMAGFYMGPDGYIWGREFISTEPDTPRELIIQKQWYSFMLWGRLSYDPQLPDAHFQRVLAHRYPQAEASLLFEAITWASRVIPLVTRTFWRDIDLQWFPEACLSHPRWHKGFYTVRDFVEGQAMPASGVLGVRQFVEQDLAGATLTGVSPRQVSHELTVLVPAKIGQALEALERSMIDRGVSPPKELRLQLGDCRAMQHLAAYYGWKIQAAVDLACLDRTAEEVHRQAATHALEAALQHWKDYARVATAQYHSQLLVRVGPLDLNRLTPRVAEDIAMARDWPASQQ